MENPRNTKIHICHEAFLRFRVSRFAYIVVLHHWIIKWNIWPMHNFQSTPFTAPDQVFRLLDYKQDHKILSPLLTFLSACFCIFIIDIQCYQWPSNGMSNVLLLTISIPSCVSDFHFETCNKYCRTFYIFLVNKFSKIFSDTYGQTLMEESFR